MNFFMSLIASIIIGGCFTIFLILVQLLRSGLNDTSVDPFDFTILFAELLKFLYYIPNLFTSFLFFGFAAIYSFEYLYDRDDRKKNE